MYEYLTEEYERKMRPAPKPIVHWILLVLVVAGVTALFASVSTHAAQRAVIEAANSAYCFRIGC